MPELALALYVLFLALGFGLRSWLQWRRTGSTGIHRLSGRPGSAEWLAGVSFFLALALGVAAPALALLDVVEPIAALDGPGAHALGIVLALAGIALTLYAQLAMGSSWRVGVDPDERTQLVTEGPFALVRNPIFSAVGVAGLGLALLVPSVLALAGFLALLAAIELQVRVVEEPHLRRVHGEHYRAYAAQTGRFVPGLGRLRRAS